MKDCNEGLYATTQQIEERGYQEGRCYDREGRFFASEGDEELLEHNDPAEVDCR
jgi:hypothetical protein